MHLLIRLRGSWVEPRLAALFVAIAKNHRTMYLSFAGEEFF